VLSPSTLYCHGEALGGPGIESLIDDRVAVRLELRDPTPSTSALR